MKLITQSIGLWLTIGSLFASYTVSAQHTASARALADQANLALRQVCHHLYLLACDSTSRIPAVTTDNDSTYSIRLGIDLDYEALPPLVDQALRDYGIKSNYYIAVRSCIDSTIMLGYSLTSFKNNETPCAGRVQDSRCSILSLTLYDTSHVHTTGSRYFTYLTGFGILGFGVLVLLFVKKNDGSMPYQESTPDTTDESIVLIGNSTYDAHNLWLETDGIRSDLTYREAKLLSYLLAHANQVLKRQDILDHVWEEEGVIVGRSLDVFISRLRKILKSDPTVKITNIHSVGYRLDVTTNRSKQ